MIFIVVLACVFPLTVYCFILSLVNRRPRPLVASGTWDVVGLLFGASGFILFGGPYILDGFNQRWRDYWLFSRSSLPFRGLGDQGWYIWLGVWVLYFALVVGGSLLLLKRRSRVLSIYNIDTAVINDALTQALDRLKLEWADAAGRIVITQVGEVLPDTDVIASPALEPPQPSPGAVSPAAITGYVAHAPDRPAAQKLLLELDAFPAMRHVSLCWQAGAGPLRKEIEAELTRILAEVRTDHNPVGAWLGSIAGCLFTSMFFTLLFLIVMSIMNIKTR